MGGGKRTTTQAPPQSLPKPLTGAQKLRLDGLLPTEVSCPPYILPTGWSGVLNAGCTPGPPEILIQLISGQTQAWVLGVFVVVVYLFF